MMELGPPPLILCMENASSEEVKLQVESHDNFRSFLEKAKTQLGFDIDINSITGNQPVSLDDNIYDYLINAEENLPESIDFDPILEPVPNDELTQLGFDIDINSITGNQPVSLDDNIYDYLINAEENLPESIDFDPILEPVPNDELYVLDDGTQIRASQIHFDNEDPPVDLTAEDIPFVKYADCSDDDTIVESTKNINIVESPVARWSNNASPSFINSLPFKVVNINVSNFEAQISKYLESRRITQLSESKLLTDKKVDESKRNLIREEVLTLFTDSPVTSLPYDKGSERRKNVRKTDPSRQGHKYNKSYVKEKDSCFICGNFVDCNIERLYLFDNEDQKLHRCSPQKKYSAQLKIICERCLAEHFTACRNKSPTEMLNCNEYLVIRNNQQYIFRKTSEFTCYSTTSDDKSEFVNVEIGPDGEIITKPVDTRSDDVVLVKDERKCEKEREHDDDIVDLEEADDEVKEFLGKYECDGNDLKELKCRFCERIFANLDEVMEHGEEHKHELEDGTVLPCPLCNYGYANLKWLKGHLRAAHNRTKDTNKISKESDDVIIPPHIPSSPVARRTRSCIKRNDDSKDTSRKTDETEDAIKELKTDELPEYTIKTEVKQECLDSDDEGIWILQADDNEATEQLHKLFHNKKDDKNVFEKTRKCPHCSVEYTDYETHKCKRRGRKRKTKEYIVPTKADVDKRGGECGVEDDNGLLVERTRRKKTRKTSDCQKVTCHGCNESFTSKVRLKFHMQFHESTNLKTSSGEYTCVECDDAQFATETELFDHVHFQHDKHQRWQCPVEDCGKTFFLRATLTKHSRTHTDTRRYVCVTCGKRFLDKQTLDEHGVTHLQIKPYQCHICLKQLTRRSRLRMHLRAHEEELAPTLVMVCRLCMRAFRDHQEAQDHATKSECAAEEDACDEPTVTEHLSPTSGLVTRAVRIDETPCKIEREVSEEESATLLQTLCDKARLYIRVVRIEKAFRCEYCEDVFYLEHALNSHRLIHKGVKNPFTCHICKVSFATYSRCTTHKTTHGFYKRSVSEKKSEEKAGPSATGILGYGGFPVVKHFLCEDCGRSYLHWTYLQVHRRMKHANENFMYKCNQCELTFPNSWSAAYHRKKFHGTTCTEDGGATKIRKTDYRIPCRDCEEILPNKTALYKHRKKEHSDGILDPDDILSQNERTACSKCGHNFQDSSALQKHLTEVHGHESEGPLQRSYLSTRPVSLPRHRQTNAERQKKQQSTHIAVIQIKGLNPTEDDVMSRLVASNIPLDKIIDITMISFPKGMSSIVPNSMRALALLGDMPKTEFAWRNGDVSDSFQPTRNTESISQPGTQDQGDQMQPFASNTFPPTIHIEEMLVNGGLVIGKELTQLDDTVLLDEVDNKSIVLLQ